MKRKMGTAAGAPLGRDARDFDEKKQAFVLIPYRLG